VHLYDMYRLRLYVCSISSRIIADRHAASAGAADADDDDDDDDCD